MLNRGNCRIALFTNLGHGSLALESPADPIVDTLWFPPALLDAMVAVGLVAPRTRLMDRAVSGDYVHT